MIKPYPGLNYAHFNLENVDAVLHDLYHSGTACASTQWGENYSLLEFIKLAENEILRFIWRRRLNQQMLTKAHGH